MSHPKTEAIERCLVALRKVIAILITHKIAADNTIDAAEAELATLNGGSEAAVAEKVCDDYYGGKYQQEEDTPRESLKRIIVEALASAPPVDAVSYDKCYTTTGCILPNDHKGNCYFGIQAEVTELKRLLERTVIGYHARYCNGKFDDCHDPTCEAARKAIE